MYKFTLLRIPYIHFFIYINNVTVTDYYFRICVRLRIYAQNYMYVCMRGGYMCVTYISRLVVKVFEKSIVSCFCVHIYVQEFQRNHMNLFHRFWHIFYRTVCFHISVSTVGGTEFDSLNWLLFMYLFLHPFHLVFGVRIPRRQYHEVISK